MSWDRTCSRRFPRHVTSQHSMHIMWLDKHAIVSEPHPNRCVCLATVTQPRCVCINALAIELDAVVVFAHNLPLTVHKLVSEDDTTEDITTLSSLPYQQ